MRFFGILTMTAGAFALPINQACYKDRATNTSICTDSKSAITNSAGLRVAAVHHKLLNSLLRFRGDGPENEIGGEQNKLSKEEIAEVVEMGPIGVAMLPVLLNSLQDGKGNKRMQLNKQEAAPHEKPGLTDVVLHMSQLLDELVTSMKQRDEPSKEDLDKALVKYKQLIEKLTAVANGNEKRDALEVESGRELDLHKWEYEPVTKAQKIEEFSKKFPHLRETLTKTLEFVDPELLEKIVKLEKRQSEEELQNMLGNANNLIGQYSNEFKIPSIAPNNMNEGDLNNLLSNAGNVLKEHGGSGIPSMDVNSMNEGDLEKMLGMRIRCLGSMGRRKGSRS